MSLDKFRPPAAIYLKLKQLTIPGNSVFSLVNSDADINQHEIEVAEKGEPLVHKFENKFVNELRNLIFAANEIIENIKEMNSRHHETSMRISELHAEFKGLVSSEQKSRNTVIRIYRKLQYFDAYYVIGRRLGMSFDPIEVSKVNAVLRELQKSCINRPEMSSMLGSEPFRQLNLLNQWSKTLPLSPKDPEFISIIECLDHIISYFASHILFRDASSILVKFKELQARALGMLTGSIKSLIDACCIGAKKELDPVIASVNLVANNPNSDNDAISAALQKLDSADLSILQLKFSTDLSSIRSLGTIIESRSQKRSYGVLLEDLYRYYCEKRSALVFEVLQARLRLLPGRQSMTSDTASGISVRDATFKRIVVTSRALKSEHSLFFTIFAGGARPLSREGVEDADEDDDNDIEGDDNASVVSRASSRHSRSGSIISGRSSRSMFSAFSSRRSTRSLSLKVSGSTLSSSQRSRSASSFQSKGTGSGGNPNNLSSGASVADSHISRLTNLDRSGNNSAQVRKMAVEALLKLQTAVAKALSSELVYVTSRTSSLDILFDVDNVLKDSLVEIIAPAGPILRALGNEVKLILDSLQNYMLLRCSIVMNGLLNSFESKSATEEFPVYLPVDKCFIPLAKDQLPVAIKALAMESTEGIDIAAKEINRICCIILSVKVYGESDIIGRLLSYYVRNRTSRIPTALSTSLKQLANVENPKNFITPTIDDSLFPLLSRVVHLLSKCSLSLTSENFSNIAVQAINSVLPEIFESAKILENSSRSFSSISDVKSVFLSTYDVPGAPISLESEPLQWIFAGLEDIQTIDLAGLAIPGFASKEIRQQLLPLGPAAQAARSATGSLEAKLFIIKQLVTLKDRLSPTGADLTSLHIDGKVLLRSVFPAIASILRTLSAPLPSISGYVSSFASKVEKFDIPAGTSGFSRGSFPNNPSDPSGMSGGVNVGYIRDSGADLEHLLQSACADFVNSAFSLLVGPLNALTKIIPISGDSNTSPSATGRLETLNESELRSLQVFLVQLIIRVVSTLPKSIIQLRRKVGFFLSSSSAATVLLLPVKDRLLATLQQVRLLTVEICSDKRALSLDQLVKDRVCEESSGDLMQSLAYLGRVVMASETVIVDPNVDSFGCDSSSFQNVIH